MLSTRLRPDSPWIHGVDLAVRDGNEKTRERIAGRLDWGLRGPNRPDV